MSDAARVPTPAHSAAAHRAAALDARGLTKSYTLGHETILILDGLDLTVARGERIAVVGASGSGKTTMIHILGLLDRPDAGSLSIDGEDALAATQARRTSVRNAAIGFVFQFYHLVPELSALDNVMLPARIGAGWGWFGAAAAAKARASDLLSQVGLAGRERHRPGQLSGGERQRVAIARSLMQRPHVLFCDEPTGNLDPRTARGVQELLLEMNAEERAMVLVTHDEAFARRCDRVLRLVDGRLVPGA